MRGKYDEAQNKRQQESDAKNCVRINLKLTKSTDSDIIEFLELSGNKQGTIKEALRAFMPKQ